MFLGYLIGLNTACSECAIHGEQSLAAGGGIDFNPLYHRL
jgi:hypothetical protein